ncbi:hypothetical protein ACP70R_008707 [Stipagrostis hirtigluma subsp. patula]
MDSEVALAGGDRLSRLSDGVLGHILSFLPAAEAARAALLSRRWRRVFAAVHTLSFEEPDRSVVQGSDDGNRSCWSPEYYVPVGRGLMLAPPSFVTGVTAALLARNRRAHVPLRALRVAVDDFRAASEQLVDGWLSYAVHQAAGELHVDLRLRREPICRRVYTLRRRGAPDDRNGDGQGFIHRRTLMNDGEPDYHDGEEDPTAMSPDCAPSDYDSMEEEEEDSASSSPCRRCCSTLRSLRLGSCWLDPPSAIALPSLDTLHLTWITGPSSGVQRLVAACPRLADLTLEAFVTVTKLSVLHTRLRRLTLRCCHDLAAVAVDSSELREFEYRGAVPHPTFLTMNGPCRISSCTLDFCGEEASHPVELAWLRDFLQLFTATKSLHLKSARLGGGIDSDISTSVPAFPVFAVLQNLELTGMLPEDDTTAIAAVTRILERTPNLETMSLFFLPGPEDPNIDDYGCHEDVELHAAHQLKYNRYTPVTVSEDTMIPCLRERTREINFVHYQGGMAQRVLAKFLLRNAPVVDEVCCGFPLGPLWMQNKLMEEIRGWVINKSAKMLFL